MMSYVRHDELFKTEKAYPARFTCLWLTKADVDALMEEKLR